MTTTGLMLYGTKATSSIISGAAKFCTNSIGGATTTSNTQCGTNAKYGEYIGLGDTGYTWPVLNTIPATPTGRGFILESSLNGNTTIAGPYGGVFALSLSTGTATGCTLTLRFFVYTSNSASYRLLGSTTSSSFSMSNTVTNYGVGEVFIAANDWGQFDYLYCDVWLYIGTNSTGSGTATARMGVVTSASTSGWENYANVSTPGYYTTGSASVFGPFKNDTFWRADQSGIGTASDGNAWALSVGTAGNQAQSIVTDRVHNTCTTGNAAYLSTLGTAEPSNYVEAVCQVQCNNASTNRYGPVVRFLDSTHYVAVVLYNGTLAIYGSGTGSGVFSYSANTPYTIKVRAYGQKIMGKVWASASAEPASWTFTATDTTHMCMGKSGFIYYPTASTSDTADFWTFSSYDMTQSLNAGGRFNLGVAPTTPYPVQVKSLSPTVYYRLCDNTYECKDEMGAYNAKPTGLTGATPLKYLQSGPSIGLDANSESILFTATNTDNYIDVNAGFTITNWPTLTVECWFKLTTSTFAANMRLVNNSHTDSDKNGFQFFIAANAASLNFEVGNGTTTGKAICTPAAAISYGVWHHAVGVYDGANVKCYLDGVLGGTAPALTGNVHAGSGAQMTIGRGVPYNSDYFGGNLAEVAVYPSALTATQVKNNFIVGSWYSSNYQYRREVVIQGSQVSGTTNFSSFPMFFSWTDDTLKTRDNGGHIYNASGYDVLFTDNTSNVWYPHEIEKYDGSAGTLLAHVNLATLFANSNNTTILMYYGRPGYTTAPNGALAWNSDYQAVWHFGDGSTVSTTDSTSHGVTLDNTYGTPNAVAGQINGAVNFDAASTEYYKTTGNSAITGTANRTLSFWSKNSNTSHSGLSSIGTSATGGQFGAIININHWIIWGFGSGHDLDTTKTPPTGAWHYEAITRDTSGNYVWYEDGVSIYSYTYVSNSTNAGPYYVGAMNDNGTLYYYTGAIDELRWQSTNRNADWIKTEYNNQKTPADFISVGTESNSPIFTSGTKYAQGRARFNVSVTKYLSGRFKQSVKVLKNGMGRFFLTLGAGTTLHAQGRTRFQVAKTVYAQGRAKVQVALTKYTQGRAKFLASQTRYAQGRYRSQVANTRYAQGRSKIAAEHYQFLLGRFRENVAQTKYASGRFKLQDVGTVKYQIGNSPHATGHGTQTHIFYAENTARWWAFFFYDTGSIYTASSTDGLIWEAGPGASLVHNSGLEGRNLSVSYKNISSHDVVHISLSYMQTNAYTTVWRAELVDKNNITFGTETQIDTMWTGAIGTTYDGNVVVFDSTNKTHVMAGYDNTDPCNVGSWEFPNADTGTAWTIGSPTNHSLYTAAHQVASHFSAADAYSSGYVFTVQDNGNASPGWTNLKSCIWNNSAWQTVYDVYSSPLASNADPNDWGCCMLDSTHALIVRRNRTPELDYTKCTITSGTTQSWSSPATMPTGYTVPASGAGIALIPDGSGGAYCCIIDSGAANAIKYIHYDGSSWSSWTTLVSSSATRNNISVTPAFHSTTAVLAWTDGSGSNYDIKSIPFSVSLSQTRYAQGRFSMLASATRYSTGRYLMRVARTVYAQGRAKFRAGNTRYSQGREKLSVARTLYESGRAVLRVSSTKYAQGRAKFLVAVTKYTQGRAKLSVSRADYAQGRYRSQVALMKYAQGREKLQVEHYQLATGRLVLKAAQTRYAQGRQKLQVAKTLYAQGRAKEQARVSQNATGRLKLSIAILAAGRFAMRVSRTLYGQGRMRLQASKTLNEQGRFSLVSMLSNTRYAAGRFKQQASQTRYATGRAVVSTAHTLYQQGRTRIQVVLTRYASGRMRMQVAKALYAQGRYVLGFSGLKLAQGRAKIGALHSQNATGRFASIIGIAHGLYASGRFKTKASHTLFQTGRFALHIQSTFFAQGRTAIRASGSRFASGLTKIQRRRTGNLFGTAKLAVGQTRFARGRFLLKLALAQTRYGIGRMAMRVSHTVFAMGRIATQVQRAFYGTGRVRIAAMHTQNEQGRLALRTSITRSAIGRSVLSVVQQQHATGRTVLSASQRLYVAGRTHLRVSQTASQAGRMAVGLSHRLSLAGRTHIAAERLRNLTGVFRLVIGIPRSKNASGRFALIITAHHTILMHGARDTTLLESTQGTVLLKARRDTIQEGEQP